MMIQNKIQTYEINPKDYEIIREIKRGGFGMVFLVEHKTTHCQFAAKVNLPTSDLMVDQEKFSSREIGILARVQAPTIIRFFGFSKTDFDNNPNITILMEYKDNGSLKTLIEKENRSQSPPEYDNTTKQIILCGIAHGMMILHSRGVIHRDLKPDNVLLDSNYRPCITDFGLSKFVDSDVSQSQSHAGIGTTAYIAPEVIESNHYGPKADVYSFAILMYEVITGERAFSEIFKKPHFAIGNFLFRITNGERPVFKSPIKPSLQKLIEECWSSDPHARPSFRTIFEKLSLSLNFDDKIIINSDEKTKLTEHDYEFSEYCLDNVDHDQVYDYVESITRHETTSTETNLQAIVEEQSKLIKENRELINQLMKQNQNHQMQIDQLTKKHQEEIDLLTKQNQENQKEIELLKRALCSSSSSVFNKEPSKSHEILISSTPNLPPPTPLTRPYNSLDGLTIQQIKEKINKDQLTEISLPSTITDIIDFAFHGCQFTQITIPESVKSIGSNAFSNCLSLTQIIIPSSVKSIKDTAFQNCRSLKSVSIPSSVHSIADSTFSYCESLSQIELPSSITSIGYYSFYHCNSLSELTIPSSVTSIGHYAFSNCTSLTQITIPSSVKTIGNGAFKGCSKLSPSIQNELEKKFGSQIF